MPSGTEIFKGVVIGLIVMFIGYIIKVIFKKNFSLTGNIVFVLLVLGVIGALVAGILFPPPLQVTWVAANNFDLERSANNCRIGSVLGQYSTIQDGQEVRVLLFAGRENGPYWLQGREGKSYSEESSQKQGKNMVVGWKVSDVYLCSDAKEIRAIAVFEKDVQNIIKVGRRDKDADSALKYESLVFKNIQCITSAAFTIANTTSPYPTDTVKADAIKKISHAPELPLQPPPLNNLHNQKQTVSKFQ